MFDFDELLLQSGNIFGLPFDETEADVVIIPVPWDCTVSYNAGTSAAPAAIHKASTLLDLFDYEYKQVWQAGFFMANIPADVQEHNIQLRQKAQDYIDYISAGNDIKLRPDLLTGLEEINNACEKLAQTIETQSKSLLDAGKIVGILGGEHSVPLGLIRALAQKHDSFSVLQIDAHADLRNGYEGFTYSHASIMHHALQCPQITTLVQAGIRDVSFQELKTIQESAGRIRTFFDKDLHEALAEGATWKQLCDNIIGSLSDKVYISFDIDGLVPQLCPHTGTPVPGGFEFNQVVYLLGKLLASGRTIIGFDLCEVAPGQDDWDANVGARILFKLCAAAAISNNKYTL